MFTAVSHPLYQPVTSLRPLFQEQNNNTESDDDEDLVFLYLLYNSTRILETGRRFHFPSVPAEFTLWKEYFRFTKDEIVQVVNAMQLPNPVVLPSRHSATSCEAMCIFLFRLSYPGRLCQSSRFFGRSRAALSLFYNYIVEWIYRRYHHLLTWDHVRITQRHLERFTDAIAAQGAPLMNCIGFIDGTVRGICRPSYNQKIAFNGHKVSNATFIYVIYIKMVILTYLHHYMLEKACSKVSISCYPRWNDCTYVWTCVWK
jgi:hypothetical protein